MDSLMHCALEAALLLDHLTFCADSGHLHGQCLQSLIQLSEQLCCPKINTSMVNGAAGPWITTFSDGRTPRLDEENWTF